MVQTMLIGIGGIVGVMILWVGVQALWRKTFTDYLTEEDVLAGRSSCGNCGCTTICHKDGHEQTTKDSLEQKGKEIWHT